MTFKLGIDSYPLYSSCSHSKSFLFLFLFLIYLWCSLRSVLHAYIVEGLPTHHKLSKHGSSQCKCMHVGMCVCSIHPNTKMKRATSNAVVTSVLLSFQKDFFLFS